MAPLSCLVLIALVLSSFTAPDFETWGANASSQGNPSTLEFDQQTKQMDSLKVKGEEAPVNLEFPLNTKRIVGIPFQQDQPNVSGNYRFGSMSMNLQVIQEGRRIRIVIPKDWDRWIKHEDDPKTLESFVSSGWTVGAEVCLGEIDPPQPDSKPGRFKYVVPIKARCLLRYNRSLVGKVPQYPDVWADLVNSEFQYGLPEGVMRIALFPKQKTIPAEYDAYRKITPNPEPLYLPGWVGSGVYSGYRPEVMVLERFGMSLTWNDVNLQTFEWTAYAGRIKLRAVYKGRSENSRQATLRIERNGKVVYQYRAEEANLYYDGPLQNRSLFSRDLDLTSATKSQPGTLAYKFEPGDVVVAELDGLVSRLVLTTPSANTVVNAPAIRFSRQRSGKFEEIKDKAAYLNEELYIEAEYPTPQTFQQRDGSFEWKGNKDDPVFIEGARYDETTGTWTATITYTRVIGSDKLFRAGPFTPLSGP